MTVLYCTVQPSLRAAALTPFRGTRLALTPTAHAIVAAAALAGRGRAAATPTPSTLERRRSDPTSCRLKLELAHAATGRSHATCPTHDARSAVAGMGIMDSVAAWPVVSAALSQRVHVRPLLRPALRAVQ